MKHGKKLISLLLALVLILSVCALALTAFGKSQELTLNVKQSAVIDGEDDLEWFYYTPEKSGVYSFLSYNIPASEAYLFVKEKTGLTTQYVQEHLASMGLRKSLRMMFCHVLNMFMSKMA